MRLQSESCESFMEIYAHVGSGSVRGTNWLALRGLRAIMERNDWEMERLN